MFQYFNFKSCTETRRLQWITFLTEERRLFINFYHAKYQCKLEDYQSRVECQKEELLFGIPLHCLVKIRRSLVILVPNLSLCKHSTFSNIVSTKCIFINNWQITIIHLSMHYACVDIFLNERIISFVAFIVSFLVCLPKWLLAKPYEFISCPDYLRISTKCNFWIIGC